MDLSMALKRKRMEEAMQEHDNMLGSERRLKKRKV